MLNDVQITSCHKLVVMSLFSSQLITRNYHISPRFKHLRHGEFSLSSPAWCRLWRGAWRCCRGRWWGGCPRRWISPSPARRGARQRSTQSREASQFLHKEIPINDAREMHKNIDMTVRTWSSRVLCVTVNSLLLDHMGLITWCSTLKMTAVMITAARVALGMKAQNGIRKARQTITSSPVYTPPKAVLTPLELFTAVLEKMLLIENGI